MKVSKLERDCMSEHVKEIALVRHGSTNRNGLKRVCRMLVSEAQLGPDLWIPDHEVPLNKVGINEAKALGRKIAELGLRYDYYYDSGYMRSRQTLDILLEALPDAERADIKRRSHMDLREREPGYTFFMTFDEVCVHFPWYPTYEALVGPVHARPPGGESISDAWFRVHMFLKSLRRARAGQRVLIVTHGRIMLGFRYWLEKIPAHDADNLYRAHQRIKNCTMWRFEYNSDTHRYLEVTDSSLGDVWQCTTGATENDD